MNASESVSALLKGKVDYKKNELPDFLDSGRNHSRSNRWRLNVP